VRRFWTHDWGGIASSRSVVRDARLLEQCHLYFKRELPQNAVYLPEAGLPRQKFNEALLASWLVWSPEGSGWDSFRHYEVCLAGSVAVINFPTIRRHAPLLDGVHCFYYGIEGDDLS
jgi:hypothetical protein